MPLSNATLAAITRAAQRLDLNEGQLSLLHEHLLSERPTSTAEFAARWGVSIFTVRRRSGDLKKRILERLTPEQRDEAHQWFRSASHRSPRARTVPDEEQRRKHTRRQTEYRERLKSYKTRYVSLWIQLAGWYARQPDEWQRSPRGQEFKAYLADPERRELTSDQNHKLESL